MRVISQDGMIDVPYEQVSVEQRGNEIWCGYSATIEKRCTGKLFAKYSTVTEAQKVIEMLHTAFENYNWIKTIGNSEELKNLVRCITKEEFDKMTSSYFQFPAPEPYKEG